MTTDTKPCTTCGKPFKRSRHDYTVRCPACRAAPKPERAHAGYAARTRVPVRADALTCTVQFATTGRCGKPATHAFTTPYGETFAECAEHRA